MQGLAPPHLRRQERPGTRTRQAGREGPGGNAQDGSGHHEGLGQEVDLGAAGPSVGGRAVDGKRRWEEQAGARFIRAF